MKSQSIIDNTGDMHTFLIESLKNKKKAEAYLKIALEEYQEDGDTAIFLIALRNLAEAQGGISWLAKETHLNRQSLYQTLSGKGNPRLITLGKILTALGYHFSIVPCKRDISATSKNN